MDDTHTQDVTLRLIDNALREQWYLGREIILCWTYSHQGLLFFSAPYYLIGTLISPWHQKDTNGSAGQYDPDSIPEIFHKTRYASESLQTRLRMIEGVNECLVRLPDSGSSDRIHPDIIDDCLRRYSISYVEGHAVALVDIVGFSTYNAFDQVTLLSSLSHSVNSAYAKLHEQDIKVNFAQTTTGDGFYIWSTELTIESNVNLYHLVQLILADNAIARTKSYGHTAPILKTVFHIGNYYEYHQSAALKPIPYSYIVGHVTIELTRIIESAVPGQILMGDFQCQLPAAGRPDEYIDVDTIKFTDILKKKSQGLKGIEISQGEIASIVCYLTGQRVNNNEFTISRYQITDKHNYLRTAFNAKVNIYRQGQPPIYMGIQEKDLFDTPRIRRG